ncbi:hypothetical protein PoB_005460700 [Plakobranchus ocellatus]|uniref:Uncharacterized protein n=1 Tax=Plakobranchus ocellatus TaxID=259542 RepID=A0AAV4C9R7_9GAST|nr:hypothetical protein PoB_005460700 [Plakobranchus ocellatus]
MGDVYDGQRSRSNLMYWWLMQFAHLLQGDLRLQGPSQACPFVPGRNTGEKGLCRARSLAIEPPTTYIVRNQNRIKLALRKKQCGAVLRQRVLYRPKTLLLPTSMIIDATARSHARKRTE